MYNTFEHFDGYWQILTNENYFLYPILQSSNEGRAFIISGGIGQTQVTVGVEAKKTSFIRYSAKVFGYN